MVRSHVLLVMHALKQIVDLSIQRMVKKVLVIRSHVIKVTNAIKQAADISIREIVKEEVVVVHQ